MQHRLSIDTMQHRLSIHLTWLLQGLCSMNPSLNGCPLEDAIRLCSCGAYCQCNAMEICCVPTAPTVDVM